jgi:hypothetical protein
MNDSALSTFFRDEAKLRPFRIRSVSLDEAGAIETAAEEKMMATTQTGKRVEIDFMFIDLDVCTRCKGTDESLEIAIQAVRASSSPQESK